MQKRIYTCMAPARGCSAQKGFCTGAKGVPLPLDSECITQHITGRKSPIRRCWQWISDTFAVRHMSPGNKRPHVQETGHMLMYKCKYM